VVEFRIPPGRGVVALLACLRKAGSGMVRVGRPLEVCQVTGNAQLGGTGKLAAHVALRALHVHVRSGQRKLGQGIVIKLGALPGGGRVAGRTILRKSGATVVWILGVVEVRQVTARTIRPCGCEVIVGVASGTFQRGVHAGQVKPSRLGVIELRAQPTVHGMALLAIRGEVDRGMVRAGGLGEFSGMAGDARGGESHELSAGRAFMAGIARNGGVRSYQRKAVLMLLNVLDRDMPSFDRVARLTFRSHLSAMDVCVALGALVSNLFEHQFCMTLRAGNRHMHSAQWICRLFVIEIGNCTDWFPAQTGVARLAGKIEGAVWASG
jgi:hypothetical protein